MTVTRNGNTITVAPFIDSLCGLKSGWAIRFTEFPQFLFHAERNQTRAHFIPVSIPPQHNSSAALGGARINESMA